MKLFDPKLMKKFLWLQWLMVFLVEFHTRVDLLTVLTYLGKLGALNSTARTKECKHRGASKHPKRSKKNQALHSGKSCYKLCHCHFFTRAKRVTFTMLENTQNVAFEFWHFPPFCPIKSELSGNTVWLQASEFSNNRPNFWHFYWKCKRARFARNFECNFCSNWKKNEGGGLVSCWSEKMSLRHHRFSCLDTPSPIICACARLWLLSHHPWGWPYHGCSCRLAATWSFPLKCFDNGQNSSIERRPDIGFSWPCFARITKINFSSIF